MKAEQTSVFQKSCNHMSHDLLNLQRSKASSIMQLVQPTPQSQQPSVSLGLSPTPPKAHWSVTVISATKKYRLTVNIPTLTNKNF
jgi:hypothetical protein